MDTVVKFVLDMFKGYIGILQGIKFTSFFGFNVTYFDLIIAFIAVAMVVGLFWKGARG